MKPVSSTASHCSAREYPDENQNPPPAWREIATGGKFRRVDRRRQGFRCVILFDERFIAEPHAT
jgi:hypothetical protein